ncbi:MAG: hypothetical protein WDM79_02150 [Terricaulis sp.]
MATKQDHKWTGVDQSKEALAKRPTAELKEYLRLRQGDWTMLASIRAILRERGETPDA